MKKSAKSDRLQVMVCVLKSPRDKEILLKERWYRIPLASAPRRRPKYLAFYQPAIFGKEGKRIELYGRVGYRRVKKRIALLPEEVNHANAQEPYVQFILSKLSKLRQPLINRGGLRVSFGFASLSKLRQAPDLHRLFGVPPLEALLAKILEENNIPFYRQYPVRTKAKKLFRLDFAVPARQNFAKQNLGGPRQNEWLDVECDGFRWHSQKTQREEDRKRDSKLRELGWTVLRISEEELVKNPTEVLRRIKTTLDMSRFSKLYSLLEKYYGKRGAWVEVEQAFKEEGMKVNMEDFYNPFKNLVIGILSQNTSDKNSTKAYISLTKKFKITPKVLAEAPEKEVRKAIKGGGLYNVKAKRIGKFAQVVLEKYSGDLNKITKLSKDKARKALLDLPGIGTKTADVFIGYCMGKEIFPIDTNINRVVKRIGIINKKAKYDEIQKELCKIFPSKKRLRGHELLIRLGRDFCKARNPLCKTCPINSVCKKNV